MASTLCFHLAHSPSLSSLHRLHYLPFILFTSPPCPHPHPHPHPHPLLSRPHRLLCSSSLIPSTPSLSPISTPPLPHLLLDLQEPDESDSDEVDPEDEEVEVEAEAANGDSLPLPILPSPELSVKEKKELASYAHSLGKKLKTQQVGKSGVTPAVVTAFLETLESKELLKLKVHGSCPGELSDVIKQLEGATGSVAVGQIGRSVILYRPSLSKMKKKEAQRIKSVWTRKPEKPTESSPTPSWRVRNGRFGKGSNFRSATRNTSAVSCLPLSIGLQ